MWKQVVELYAVKQRYLDELPRSEVGDYLQALDAFMEANHRDVIDEIRDKKALDEALTAKLNACIEEYAKSR